MTFDWTTFFIGMLAQSLFSARTLIQWILSERARRVVSPSIFWILGLLGSFLLCLYGWLREDFSIILGQCVLYYVYWWNLKILGVWRKTSVLFRTVLLLMPGVFILLALRDLNDFFDSFFVNGKIPLRLIALGTFGQMVFMSRFIYQWIYSCYRGQSILPNVFWIISLIGSSIILLYGFLNVDWVLILGHSFGMVTYVRNLCIGSLQKITDNKNSYESR